jgi:hypothetical protein
MATAMEMDEVPSYISDEEASITRTVNTENNERVKQKQRNWVKEMVFNNTYEAGEAVKRENHWGYSYTNTTLEGVKKFFRCNKVKRRGEQCAAGVYLLFNSTNDEVVLFRDKSDHTHDLIPKKSSKISNEVKETILELFELKLKPKAIIEVLHERKMAAPSIGQLYNFLRGIKATKCGPTALSLGEIEQWCLESSRSIPELDDTPFVGAYNIIYDDDDNDDDNGEDDDSGENKFRFFVTTKRLMKMASKSTKIHADATYKLIWQGFPVLIVGTTDLDRHFHPFGIAVCSNEKTQDFLFVFRALQEVTKKLGL